jgi:exopolysaccharide production protein ExoQ
LPPIVAALLCLTGMLGLFVLERDRKAVTSWALWIPIIWMLLAGSRSVTDWWGSTPQSASEATVFAEGNPVERNIFASLLMIGICILARRPSQVLPLLRLNAPLLLFFLYCCASVVWSDYPVVAFKRWTKAIGDLVMILVVLSETDRRAAIKTLLARVSFLLVPISILLIKYYPEWGRVYTHDGFTRLVGVATDKNTLGFICLLSGLSAAWRIVLAVRERQLRTLLAHGTLLAMVFWLFSIVNSATSMSIFILALALTMLTGLRVVARKPVIVHVAMLGFISVPIVALFFDIGSSLVETIGRDTTLTGRTALWEDLLAIKQNALIGAGFESFWLGSRLERLWTDRAWRPNEAHNGYLEVFLNLGWVGVTLLALVIAAGYRNALRTLRADPQCGRLLLAFILVGITFSLTEAGFRMLSLAWLSFMLAAVAVPGHPLVKGSGARTASEKSVVPTGRLVWASRRFGSARQATYKPAIPARKPATTPVSRRRPGRFQ